MLFVVVVFFVFLFVDMCCVLFCVVVVDIVWLC